MTVAQLRKKLDYVDSTRANRLKYAQLILENPKLMGILMKIALHKDDALSARAAWIVEYVCNQKLEMIYPYLDFFTENLDKPNKDSTIRPIAKVCELLVKKQYDRLNINPLLNENHKIAITTFCFDILIGNHQVAPKVYSMSALQNLSTEYQWIKTELKIILERDYITQSKGYQARARMVLKKIIK